MTDRESLLANRHYGMDLVRALAIIITLLGHSLIFFGAFTDLSAFFFLMVLGVDLFFVLSGFLIGNILIRMAQRKLDFASLRLFWFKRWMRTLPAYFVMLLVLWITQHEISWTHLLFLQNFSAQQLSVFAVSWSLSIEEYFYLSFPVAMLLLYRFAPRADVVLISIIFFILAPLALRIMASADPSANWDFSFRKQIFFRLDAAAWGVLLAWLVSKNSAWIARWHRSILVWAACIAGVIGLWWFQFTFVRDLASIAHWFSSTLFFSALSILGVLIVGIAYGLREYRTSPWSRTIYAISITSYSIYLVHLSIFIYFLPKAIDVTNAWIWLGVSILATATATAALYFLVEQPFMRWRDRIAGSAGRLHPHF